MTWRESDVCCGMGEVVAIPGLDLTRRRCNSH